MTRAARVEYPGAFLVITEKSTAKMFYDDQDRKVFKLSSCFEESFGFMARHWIQFSGAVYRVINQVPPGRRPLQNNNAKRFCV
jgi:hypothetical protein